MSEYQCPTCGAPLSTMVPTDDGDLVTDFDCGFSCTDSSRQLCPKDPNFPTLLDLQFVFQETKYDDGKSDWHCTPKIKEERIPTDWRRLCRSKEEWDSCIGLRSSNGSSKEDALFYVIESYYQRARINARCNVDLSEVETTELEPRDMKSYATRQRERAQKLSQLRQSNR